MVLSFFLQFRRFVARQEVLKTDAIEQVKITSR